MTTYSNELVIDRPLNEVVKLFQDTDKFTEWQPDLIEYDTYEGDPCCAGSKSRLRYKSSKHDDIKMVETVLESNLPEKYKVKYDTDGVQTYQNNHFEEGPSGKTIYRMDSEYDTEGLMKIMDHVNPSYFKKQTDEFMNSFKEYAEKKL